MMEGVREGEREEATKSNECPLLSTIILLKQMCVGPVIICAQSAMLSVYDCVFCGIKYAYRVIYTLC